MLPRRKSQVSRRRVFYIPGYDPNPPRRYRELYRSEGRKQAEVSGYEIDQKCEARETGWRVRAKIDEVSTVSKVDVLVWHDLLRGSMSAGITGTYLALLRTCWLYLTTGTFRRLGWLAKGPVIAALYPVVILLAQLSVALLGASLLASGAVWATYEVGTALVSYLGQQQGVSGWLWTLVGAGVFWALFLPLTLGVLRWFKSKDDRTYAYYLMQGYAYSASKRGVYPDEIEARLHEFRHRIEAALREDIDEVLIVGHSSGAQMAVSIVADIVRLKCLSETGPALSLLTLGQVIPMTSFLPEAKRIRRDLRLLATAQEITWVDVSDPSDRCCFALTDPVSVSGVSPGNSQQWPLILSAAFSEALSPEWLASLKWRFFRLHFQYIFAFDRPGDFDYFKITAGPETLGARFRGRRTSPSRIDVVASCFTSTLT